MIKRTICSAAIAFLAATTLFAAPAPLPAAPRDIPLPAPHTDGGMPLMKALALRSSSRNFAPDELPLQVLSDLLWAAAGINRPESGRRTAASANNVQNIEVYAALKSGLYLYDPKADVLKGVLDQDLRGATGQQDFVKTAPLNLVYVADFSKFKQGTDDMKSFYSGVHTGLMAQSVYLFCASEGLSVVVRGSVERDELAKLMKLRPDQKIMMAQTVGYPKES
jgi:SagB-type dehydrogenase family enzyme